MNESLRRFYVHGDQDEDDQALFFCAICDLFSPAEHFRKYHEGENMAKYGCTLDEYQRQKKAKNPVYRPINPTSAPF